MAKLIPYMFFDGNCEEAMKFYEECLGGKLNLLKASEAPASSRLPEGKKNQVMHASLSLDEVILEASDVLNEMPIEQGNTVRLNYEADNIEKLRNIFDKLSQGGSVQNEIRKEFWGGYYSSITDKFGFQWMLTCPG